MTIFTIELDLKSIEKEMGDMATNVAMRAVMATRELAMAKINSLVAEKIPDRNTAMNYLKAIEDETQHQEDGVKLRIFLTDPKLSAMDVRTEDFDMKPGLLNGPKSKTSKDGQKYTDVPLRHKTTKRGSGRYIEAGTMRQMVKKAMAEVKETGQEQRLFKQSKTKFADMLISKTQGSAQALTIRRVSEKSAPSSWIRPGREGLGIFKETQKFIESEKDHILQEAISGVGK
jgi:hypothetical protein